jgi:hypothetical protein
MKGDAKLTMKATNELVLKKVFEHAAAVDEYCAKHHCTRIMTGLFGSQNYGLDTPSSDVDTKSIIVPDLHDWLWSTEGYCNHVLTMPDGSHAEMKPVVGMFKQFVKGNINFLEILYTPYIDIAPGWEWVYESLTGAADNITRHNMYQQSRVWLGYINQMMKRTFNQSEQLGYRVDLGYNPKALMNALRLKQTFIRYFEFQRPFDESIDLSELRHELLNVKQGFCSKEYAKTLIDDMELWCIKADKYIKQHYEDKEVFNAEWYLRMLALEIFEGEDRICG